MIPGKGALGAPALFLMKAAAMALFLFFPCTALGQNPPRSCDELRASLPAAASASFGAESEPGLDLACQAILLKLSEGRSKRIPPAQLRLKAEAMVAFTRQFREQAASNADPAGRALLAQRQVYGYLADFAAGSVPFPHFLALQRSFEKHYPKEPASFFTSCDAYLLSVSFGVAKNLALESVLHLAAQPGLRPALSWLDAFYTHAETHQMEPDRAAGILRSLSGPISHKRLIQAVDDFR
jgi:hypothetical protein